jgi:hypothetical protein
VALSGRRATGSWLFDLKLTSGLILRGCTLDAVAGRYRVQPPAGTDALASVVDFANQTVSDNFQRQAVRAAISALHAGGGMSARQSDAAAANDNLKGSGRAR